MSKLTREKLLLLTSISIFLTLAKLIFDSDAANRQVSEFTFPANINLAPAKILASEPLTDITMQQPRQYDAVIAGRYYRYSQNSIPIDIEMRYIVGTLGNVDGFIDQYANQKISNKQLFQKKNYQPGMGYYSLFVSDNRAYLNSCINPQGESTFTTKQFLHNRNTQDISFHRFLPWLIGKHSLLDRRCLWANLSTPVNNNDYQSAYKALESKWLNWYQWWYNHFPRH
jgi:cyanosortase A-associated protein